MALFCSSCGHRKAWHAGDVHAGACASEEWGGDPCACAAFLPEARMTREDLLARLAHLRTLPDREAAHTRADAALLAYLDDEAIADAFDAIEKWYA